MNAAQTMRWSLYPHIYIYISLGVPSEVQSYLLSLPMCTQCCSGQCDPHKPHLPPREWLFAFLGIPPHLNSRAHTTNTYTHTLHARIVYKVCTLINASDMRLHYTKHPSASGYCCLAISTHPRWLGWLDPSELLLEYVFLGDPDESHQSDSSPALDM